MPHPGNPGWGQLRTQDRLPSPQDLFPLGLVLLLGQYTGVEQLLQLAQGLGPFISGGPRLRLSTRRVSPAGPTFSDQRHPDQMGSQTTTNVILQSG